MAQRKKRSLKTGFIFWVSFILLVILLFLINRNTIKKVLSDPSLPQFFSKKENTTDFELQKQIQTEIERINEDTHTTSRVSQHEAYTTEETARDETKVLDAEQQKTVQANPSTPEKASEVASMPIEPDEQVASKDNKTKDDKKNTSTENQKETEKKHIQIYFVQIDADGKISRVPIMRNVFPSDSPMSDALRSLFSGTTELEEKKSLRTLIPAGTKLLGATVRDGVAYINVSEHFEFNQYGIEGYLAELAQVVYTATEFSTVNSVQFLIEGQKKNYLGSDGIWIGTPLTRESF